MSDDENSYQERDCDSSGDEPIESGHESDKAKPKSAPNPPCVPPAEHSPENCEKPKETWKDLTKWEKFERCFKVGEAIGIAAGFIVLIVVCKQLKAMQDQTKVMQGQFQAMTNQDYILQGQLNEMHIHLFTTDSH